MAAPKPNIIVPALARPVAVAIVVSRYSREVTDRLERGAVEEFHRRIGAALTPEETRECRLDVIPAPGSFELPVLVSAALGMRGIDAAVALGCIVKGETRHDEYIAHAVCQSLQRLALKHRRPVGLGVLTTDTWDQALARAGGTEGNKGAEAMAAALETLAAMHAMEDRTPV